MNVLYLIYSFFLDINWHGLWEINGYGLIETIGGFDFNGTGASPPRAFFFEQGHSNDLFL